MPPFRIVMLLSDAYGGFGGIAKFNRDFLKALDACPSVERVHALPRLIETELVRLPECIVYDRHAAEGKVAFVRKSGHRGGGPIASTWSSVAISIFFRSPGPLPALTMFAWRSSFTALRHGGQQPTD